MFYWSGILFFPPCHLTVHTFSFISDDLWETISNPEIWNSWEWTCITSVIKSWNTDHNYNKAYRMQQKTSSGIQIYCWYFSSCVQHRFSDQWQSHGKYSQMAMGGSLETPQQTILGLSICYSTTKYLEYFLFNISPSLDVSLTEIALLFLCNMYMTQNRLGLNLERSPNHMLNNEIVTHCWAFQQPRSQHHTASTVTPFSSYNLVTVLFRHLNK